MPPTITLPTVPRVAAILVVHDGAEWLPSVLATIAAQRYRALDLVVVDNGSKDGSAEILARRIPADRLITLPRNQGFTRAIAAAMSHPVVSAADLLLFWHDDLVLARDGIAHLVKALVEDSSLGIVGPKLLEWSDDGVLAEVGMTIDRFGRAEPRIERRELDQGQHDRIAEVLYVSTAGMLVPREVFRYLGGFDTRFPAYRDDLDLCWRAWLRGVRVEVVPDAVGYHIGAGARAGRRFGGGAHGGRYLAERHSVAAVLKNYSAVTLLWTFPLIVLLALAKTIAFLVVRRFGEAAAVLRAYLWNLAQLPRTLRRRAAVQRRRTVPDRHIRRLFAPGLPRARVYAEALGDWLAGGSTRALIEDDAVDEPPAAGGALLRFAKRRPAAVAGLLLGLAYLIGLAPLLGPGQIVGGDIAAWPEASRSFLTAYASPHTGEPIGTSGFASPIQVVLGVFSYLGLGSQWLAQRLLVLGLVPLAWILALRAGRLITPRAGPRALGATLYALSPIVLGALGQGRYGVLVTAALLPGLVLVGVRAADTRIELATSWRASALLALGLAVGMAASPAMAPFLLAGVLAGIAVSAVFRRPGGTQATLRLVLATTAALALLVPWIVSMVVGDVAAGSTATATRLPLWRAATGVPEIVAGAGGIFGILTALASVAVIGASILLGLRRRPDVVAVLTGVVGVTALTAWAVDRLDVQWLWAPGLLMPTALAIGGLGVLAAHSAGTALAEHSFGARQLSVVIATVLLGVGLATSVARLAAGPYTGIERNPQLVPPFVTADVAAVGPYRVLLLSQDNGEVRWDVTAGTGPSMVQFGAPADAGIVDAFDAAVAALGAGGDPRAGGGLGALNVRYVVVAGDDESDDLTRALARQPALEPLPSGAGRVYRVRAWLPRAAVLPTGMATALAATGDPGNTTAVEQAGLPRVDTSAYEGVGGPGLLLLAESGEHWRAEAQGRQLERDTLRLPLGAGLDLPVWTVDDAAMLRVEPSGATGHVVVLVLQGLLFLGIVSLALRPPGFTQRREERRRTTALPKQLDADGSQQDAGTAAGPGDVPADQGPEASPPMETRT